MKNTIAFIIILVAALSLGFYSVDIAGLLFTDEKLEHMSIVRDRDLSGAIYITSENETVFDPMELVRNDEPCPYEYKDEYEKRAICEAVIKGISRFDYSSCFYDCYMDPYFRDSIQFTKDYIYMDHYKYQTYFGKEKYIDFIMTYDDLTLIYIRFYSEDESEADVAATENALKKFSSETEDFYNIFSNNDGYGFEHSFQGNVTSLFYDYWSHGMDNSEVYTLKVGENEVFNAFSMAYSIVPYLTSQYVKVDNSQFCNFWMVTFIMTLYEIELGMYSGRIKGIVDIAAGMDSNPRYSKPVYSIMNGRIYQSVYVGLYQIVVIYNINENCYEGFYAPQGRDYERNEVYNNYFDSEEEVDMPQIGY